MINIAIPISNKKQLVLDYLDETALAARLSVEIAKGHPEASSGSDYELLGRLAEEVRLSEVYSPEFDGNYSDKLQRMEYYSECLDSFHNRCCMSRTFRSFYLTNANKLPIPAVTQFFIPTAYDLSVLLEDFSICDVTMGYKPEEFVYPPTLALSEQVLEEFEANPLGLIAFDIEEYILLYLPTNPDEHLLRSLLGPDASERLQTDDTHLRTSDALLSPAANAPRNTLSARIGAFVRSLQSQKYFRRTKVVRRRSGCAEERLILQTVHCFGTWTSA